MIQSVNEIKTILNNNFTINHVFIGDYQDFISESYPAICIQPQAMNKALGNHLSFEDFNEGDSIAVWYVEEAPVDRDKSTFISKIDNISDTLMGNSRLNGEYNMGIEIVVEYTPRSTEDNIKFIAKITIEGRNV